MRSRRIIVLSVLLILAMSAALAAWQYFTPLQGQFGGQYFYPNEEQLNELCSMPLTGGVPDDPATPGIIETVQAQRGPIIIQGCLVRSAYHPDREDCYVHACDQLYTNPDFQTELGACDYEYRTHINDCGPREVDRALQRGEYCVPGGERQLFVPANCCEDGGYNPTNPLQPLWPTPANSSSQPTQEELDRFTYTVNQPCAEGLTCTQVYNTVNYYGFVQKCECNTGTHWDNEEEACVPDPTFDPPECGNGTKEAGEECDAGESNVDAGIAGQAWLDVGPGDIAELTKSSCLSTCKIAKCADGKNNDNKNGKDDQDRSCYGGAWGNETYLAGYNVEDCPLCEQKKEEDETQTMGALLDESVLTAALRPYSPGVNTDNIDQLYCRGGYNTLSGTRCECPGNTICFAPPVLDDAGTIVSFESCDVNPDKCQPLNMDEPQLWTWACKTDASCSQHYRCAYYSTYNFLSGASDKVDIFRCRHLVEDGEDGCRSRWDCKSNYTSTTRVNSSGQLPRKSSPKTKCLEINQGTPRCCNPDATDPKESCRRPSYPAQTNKTIPSFDQCQTGGGLGPIAGGDGGGDSGDGNNSGDGGNDSGTGGGSNGSNASEAACFNRNPCLASTFITGRSTGAWTYTIPTQCPLSGTQRTCYVSCVNTLNREVAGGNSSAFPNFTNCMQRTCRVDDDDLNMCPCNENFSQCFFDCADEHADCRALCAFDPNPAACRTECTNEQRSCIESCGRQCPVSASSVSNRSSTSSRSTSSNGNSSDQSSSSLSSRSSSRSSASSDGSTGGTTGGDTGGSSDGSQSSRSGNSQSSSSSVKSQGVCCEAGNCNPFGTCEKPFPNYKACVEQCGGSSSSKSTSQSSSSSSVPSQSSSVTSSSRNSSDSSSHSSISSRDSSRSSTNSSTSSVRSSSSSSSSATSTSSSRSSSSSSTLSSSTSSSTSTSRSSSRSSTSSGNTGGTTAGSVSGNTGIGGDIGTTVSGTIGGVGDTGTQTSSRSFYGFNSSALIGKDILCIDDANCGPSGRCVLGRCLTATDIAALPSFCGNARVDLGEQCDNGAMNGDRPNVSCRTDCTPARCGDGIVDTPLEQCDDGNMANGDGCSMVCLPERTAPGTLPAQVVELPFGDTGGQGDIDGGSIGGTSGDQIDKGDLGTVPSTPDTGPAALAIMIAGGAAGWLYRKRK